MPGPAGSTFWSPDKMVRHVFRWSDVAWDLANMAQNGPGTLPRTAHKIGLHETGEGVKKPEVIEYVKKFDNEKVPDGAKSQTNGFIEKSY